MELKHQLIANEIIVMGEVLGTNSLDAIGQELNYSPVLMINAIHAGERAGKFKVNFKKRNFKLSEEVSPEKLALTESRTNMGDGINLQEEIVDLITNMNSREQDVSAEELSTWLPGSTPEILQMILFVEPQVTSYVLADPKDKKSKYTFFTLVENADKQFGKKQFKK